MSIKKQPRLKDILQKETGPLTFGMFLRAARTSMGLTQVEMAKKLQISPATLCDIEKGRQLVSTKLAAKTARLAGLSEELSVQACLQDQVNKAGLPFHVALRA